MPRRRINATAIGPDAAPAGPTDPRDPPAAPRPPRAVVTILHDRALAWHAAHMGKACECTEAGRYPCAACRREVLELVALLDCAVRDTIRVVTTALERMT